MKVVSNSGPLINLAKVGQFTLLRDLFQHITIPPAVFEEVVVRGGGQPGAGETNSAQWITRGMLEQSDIANILAAELDRGEAEAIALALQEKADWLLIDERVGRRFAQRVGLKVKGTLGVLLEGEEAIGLGLCVSCCYWGTAASFRLRPAMLRATMAPAHSRA
jgi:uncharacterized protein